MPLPWLEVTPSVWKSSVDSLAAARLCNEAMATVVATQPTRFYGVALLPTLSDTPQSRPE